jgi:hypothetical protein
LLRGAQKRHNLPRLKYWELIAANLKKGGWSLSYVLSVGLLRANDLDR